MPTIERRCKGQHTLGQSRNSVWAIGYFTKYLSVFVVKTSQMLGTYFEAMGMNDKKKKSKPQLISLAWAPDMLSMAKSIAQETKYK